MHSSTKRDGLPEIYHIGGPRQAVEIQKYCTESPPQNRQLVFHQ